MRNAPTAQRHPSLGHPPWRVYTSQCRRRDHLPTQHARAASPVPTRLWRDWGWVSGVYGLLPQRPTGPWLLCSDAPVARWGWAPLVLAGSFPNGPQGRGYREPGGAPGTLLRCVYSSGRMPQAGMALRRWRVPHRARLAIVPFLIGRGRPLLFQQAVRAARVALPGERKSPSLAGAGQVLTFLQSKRLLD